MARLKVYESRGNDQNFDVYEDIDRISEHRVDGFYNLMFGPSDAKLSFYSVRNVDQPDDKSNNQLIEIRDENVRLSIPIRALLETCLNVLNGVKAKQGHLSDIRKLEDKKINDILDKIQQLVDKKHQH